MSLSSHINSLFNLGRLKDALTLVFSNPTQMDYSLYSRILQLCILRKAGKEGRLIHSRVLTNGLHSNPFMNTKLIMFYSKMGDMVTSRTLFDKMRERTVVTWTALLSGYTQNGCSKEALLVFSAMRCKGVRPNQFTYGSALRACTSLMCLGRGEQIQGCIQKSRFAKDLFVHSALVDLYSKCGKMEDACYFFESMAERDVVSWNVMIGGYANQGFTDDAFQLFRSMLRRGVIPDCFTLGNVMKAFLRGSAMMKVIQVHGFIVQLGVETHNDLTGSLIDAYAKCGSIRIAYHIYKSMPKKDAISCTALITGYAHQGVYSRDSFDLFNEIHQMHLGLDGVILCSMLNMCANTMSLDFGRQIHALAFKCQPYDDVAMGNALIHIHAGLTNEGWECFNSMVLKYKISRRAEHYSCMVDLFARGGKLEEAYNLICKMNIAPTASLWGAILGACHIYGNMSLGEVAARHLFIMEPEKSVNYVVLASIYASVGLWDSVSTTRRLMEERSIRKDPGYSLLQSTNKRMALLLLS
ncbi:hypothetical protein RHMOL_Rhmol08G0188700 [Rhododendron molle]|uniref:Uncharacterized protein n=1 Tax=Rhododendron molle TaxID=49168 RepID=A0ACC0MRY1_RHOML|nr:hypothetical protein RHMOL_Rhmol08G0188700 [Rhododendron molle]